MMNQFKKAQIAFVSGPQGSGKGTLIEGVREKDFELGLMRFQIDDFKVSREVQRQLGYANLNEAYSSVEKMIQFQNLIIETKAATLRAALRACGAEILVTERSFIDMAAYFELWCSKLNHSGAVTSDEVATLTTKYSERCYNLQHELGGSLVIVPMMDHVAFQHDPNRANFEDLDVMYELFMKHVVNSEVPAVIISTKSVDQRVTEFIDHFCGGA